MDLFDDSTNLLELDKLKTQILKIYSQMLEKVFKADNPTGTPEELAMFLEENSLEFKSNETDIEEDIEGLEDALESMFQEEDLDPVSEKSYSKPEVETGAELKAKSNESSTAPKTTAVDIQTGMWSTPKDTQVKPKTTKVEDPTGRMKKRKKTPRDISFAPVFQDIQDKLATLKQRQGIGVKEFRLG